MGECARACTVHVHSIDVACIYNNSTSEVIWIPPNVIASSVAL